MTDTTTDAEMMTAYDEWPLWPVLPLKKNTLLGFVTEDSMRSEPVCVFVGMIYDITGDEPTIEYANAAAAVADGWKID